MENLVNQQFLSSAYRGRRVFLTGHTGFKGAWLMAWLHELGAMVKGYALEPEYKGCLYDHLAPLGMAQSVIADIRNRDKLRQEIQIFQPDYIFHLAAQPLVRRSYQKPSETFDVNVVGTANLLESARGLDRPCTIVIITTDKVYENREQDILYGENDQLGGYDPYSASKACAELVVQSFRRSFFHPDTWEEHHAGIVSARAGNVIGGGDFSEDRIIPDIIRALQAGHAVEVRNPASVRPWQHVLEPLGGYLLLGALMQQAPEKYTGAYNFGPLPDDHLTVRELAELAIQSWGNGQWTDTSDGKHPHEAGLLKLDITKAKEVLHWQPRLQAAEAIRWTIEWYKQQMDIPGFTIDQINRYMAI